MVSEVLLKVEDLRVSRPGVEILRGVNLTVQAGEVHALVGLNGSGKTTLAFALAGSKGYEADSGRVLFSDEDITKLGITERARRGLTLAWQEPARFEGLTAFDYLAMGMAAPARRLVDEALEAVALSPRVYSGRMVDDALSGGERKRIELAAVYAMRPRLAVLDEPDSGVDVLCLSDIMDLVRRMADGGTTVLLITHRDEMAEVADVASLICAGTTVRTGSPTEVRRYFAQRCRRHGDLLGSQPWGADAGGSYQEVMSEEGCVDE